MGLREKIAAQQKHLKELDEHLYDVFVPQQQWSIADYLQPGTFQGGRGREELIGRRQGVLFPNRLLHSTCSRDKKYFVQAV